MGANDASLAVKGPSVSVVPSGFVISTVKFPHRHRMDLMPVGSSFLQPHLRDCLLPDSYRVRRDNKKGV